MNRYKANKAIDLSIIDKNEREREPSTFDVWKYTIIQSNDRKFDKKYFG